MTFALPGELEELRAAALRFANQQLAPAVRDAERAGIWTDDVLKVLDGFSLRDIDVPAELGGAGMGSTGKAVLLEVLAYGDPGGLPAADQPGAAVGALIACPDRQVARETVAECVAGDTQCALVVIDSEMPGPLRIEWAPGWPELRWAWVSTGDVLRLVEVPAESGAVVPHAVPPLGFHASGAVAVDLSGGSLVGEWTLPAAGGVEVRGRARLWAAAVAVGIAQAALDATLAYTTERVVFGKPVAHHQGNAFELAALATNVHGARLMVHDAADAYDRGDRHAGFWATEAWLTSIEAAIAMTDAGIQLLGGHGFLVDHLAEKRFREARMLGLLAGGRDAAEADVASLVLEVPDPIFAGEEHSR